MLSPKGELKIVYPSGKTMYFKQEETVMNDFSYYLQSEDNMKANGYKMLHVEVEN